MRRGFSRPVRAASLALAATATAGLAVVSAGQSAQAAADGCWGSGGSHTDNYGNTYGTRYCNAYVGGDVVSGGITRGYLYAGTSWFVCQEKWPGYENPPVGGARNDWWLYTQADTSTDSHHGWGWFPATKVSGGSDWGPIPNLRDCGDIPAFPFPTP